MQPYILFALLGSALVDALAPRADAGKCVSSYDGKFEVTVARLHKRDVEERAADCNNPNALVLTLNNGNLKDAKDRTGYIASNFQWQFDKPPQAGAIVTTGFSACDNSALGLKGSTTFWQCLSGNFYNLYDRNWAPQCQAVQLVILPCSGGVAGHSNRGSGAEGGSGARDVNQAVTAIPDGQPQAPVSQGGDGQPQVPPVTQISDGQPQVPTGSPATPAPPVTQISDGQPQVPTGSPATPAPPVTQISDGQPQVPTGSPATPAPPVTQISDGQPQAPTGTPQTEVPPVTQPQVPTVTPPLVPTGSPQVPIGTGTGVSPPFAPTQPPISGSSKVLPGLSVAVVVALVGMVAL